MCVKDGKDLSIYPSMLLDGTLLKAHAKTILLKSCMENFEIFSKLESGLSNSSLERRYKLSMFLACDKHSCAIPRKLDHGFRINTLRRARELTKIKPVILPSLRAKALLNILNITDTEVIKKIDEILIYESKLIAKGSPTIRAAAIISIAALECDFKITATEIADTVGTSLTSLKINRKLIKNTLKSCGVYFKT